MSVNFQTNSNYVCIVVMLTILSLLSCSKQPFEMESPVKNLAPITIFNEQTTIVPVTSAISSSALWPVSNVYDNNNQTIWSSEKKRNTNEVEWVGILFAGYHDVNYLNVYPRYASGKALGFPRQFDIYCHTVEGWISIKSDTAFPNPTQGNLILSLPRTVQCDGIGISATELGNDNNNDAFFQLAELQAGYDPGFELFRLIGNNGTRNQTEIRNVGSDTFNPEKCSNWNFDIRNPILKSNPGAIQNIYAPSVVQNGQSWNIYYGGMDGVSKINDQIKMVSSTDTFLTFDSRNTMINNGSMIHVNNASVIKTGNNSWLMYYTTLASYSLPRKNKPALSFSTDGFTWNPDKGMSSALITVTGYPDWPNADVNGSNAVIYENDTYHLYFTDFNSTPLRVHHATSYNQRDFTYQGWVLDHPIVAQDVKKLDFGDQTYYAMLLHQNINQIGYSIGSSLTTFAAPQTLFYSQNQDDRYITSGSFVISDNRVYGIIYGASSVPSLDKNAIHAKWLQKKVIFVSESVNWGENAKGLGPNRLILPMSTQIETGKFYIYDTDATTLLFVSPIVTVRQGDIWHYSNH